MELSAKWQEIRDSNSATVEATRLEQFIEIVRAKKQPFSLSLSDAKGQTVPVANWSEYKGGPLTVSIKFDGQPQELQWQPRDINNLAILLRE